MRAPSIEGPATNGKSVDSPLAQRGAVWQDAPRARPQGRTMAKHKAKRFQKRAGYRRGRGKDRASAGLSTAYGRSMALRKVLWNRNPFRYLACGRELLWKRSASCSAIHQLWCAHGARTAKLLRARPVARQFTSFDVRTGRTRQNCFALGRGQSGCFAIRGRAVGGKPAAASARRPYQARWPY